MRTLIKLLPLVVAGLSLSCTPAHEIGDKPLLSDGQALIEQIGNWLPGSYSNYAQVYASGGDGPVTDIDIRQLKTDGEAVFLFESQQRQADVSGTDIYWLKLNRHSGQAELHFTYLQEDELSLPIQEVLTAAWQRVKPACVVIMKRDGNRITGHSDPDRCQFEHPLQGQTHIYRALTLAKDTLDFENTLTLSGSAPGDHSNRLKLQKHRVFEGWASHRSLPGPGEAKAGEWQLSTLFSLRDDGRINTLYDPEMKPLAYGLKLAKLPRFEGQPAYMLLAVIDMKTGGIQAYTWFGPGSEHFELNMSWFQANLELKKPPADEAGNP